jgi:hypothetical protein
VRATRLRVAASLALFTAVALGVGGEATALTDLGFRTQNVWTSVNWVSAFPAPGKTCTYKIWLNQGNFGNGYSETRMSRVANVTGACNTITGTSTMIAQVAFGAFQLGPLASKNYTAPVLSSTAIPAVQGALSQVAAACLWGDHQAIAGSLVSDIYRVSCVP